MIALRQSSWTSTVLLRAMHSVGLLSTAMQHYLFRKALGASGRVSAWRRLGCRIDDDVQIGPRVSMRFPRNISIGDGTAIYGRAWIDAWGPVSIGRRCLFNEDITLLSAGHDIHSSDFAGDIRFVTVGDYVWLPYRIIVMPGVTIGDAAVVGSGAVVTRSVPAHAVVAGNPARVVGVRATVNFTYVPSRM